MKLAINPGVAFILFVIGFFAFGGFWFLCSSVIAPFQANLSTLPSANDFPALGQFIIYIFAAMPLIILVALFIYLSISDRSQQI